MPMKCPPSLRGRGRADFGLAIGDDELGALLHEALGDAGADAAGGADDERDAVLQMPHASFCRIWSFKVSISTAASTRAPRIICV